MANRDPAVITIFGDHRKLRALVRNSIRGNVAMTRHEEQSIEETFLRLARELERKQRSSTQPAGVSHG